MKNKKIRCYQLQALCECRGETGLAWVKKAEKDLEESLLWEMMFELGPTGSIGSRQTENEMGCVCTKPSVGRKAWSGGSWQLGLGRAVSYQCG